MKAKLSVVAVMVAVLWFGYALGYHQGRHYEQSEWLSTAKWDANSRQMYFTVPQPQQFPRLTSNGVDSRDLPLR
jgi:hypothetical protein